MLSRRAFFARAVTAATALTIADDPERLLWTPGARTISIPAPRVRLWQQDIKVGFRTMGIVGHSEVVAVQQQINAQISAQVEALARHGLPPPRWYPAGPLQPPVPPRGRRVSS